MDVFASSLIEDLHWGRPRVEITGNNRVLVENHKGIKEYDGQLLRIKCSGCEVVIKGDGLELTALSIDELAVTGTIISVEYSTGRGEVEV